MEDVIDAIMIPPNNKDPNAGQLPGPVPLVQMIDVLVDMWEAEGLYCAAVRACQGYPHGAAGVRDGRGRGGAQRPAPRGPRQRGRALL